ncbi:hypothetical protein CDO33_12410 [Clostridium thermosuccinogenes]|nr:hypothetical protein CDO33_12410 [Pseudoclostridium thermosuccinogenes]
MVAYREKRRYILDPNPESVVYISCSPFIKGKDIKAHRISYNNLRQSNKDKNRHAQSSLVKYV